MEELGDGFNENDARVACRQLGFSTGSASAYTDGWGSGTIWLDDIGCYGNETRIDSCSHIGWGNHNCVHLEDVGIRCYGEKDVNGNWGQWSAWGSCTVSCSSGTRQRSRRCNNPLPSSGGFDCVGSIIQTENCSPGSCPVDGEWSMWSHWTYCSVSCGGGMKNRTRMCDYPTPANGGLYCNGSSEDIRNCNNVCCPVNGNWGAWSMWNKCNTTCGEGIQNRTRICDNPAPLFAGLGCFGYYYEIQNCNASDCSVLSGAKAQGRETESACSGGLLGGIAGGCIIATIVIIVIGQFAFRKLRAPIKEQRPEVSMCHVVDANEVQLRSRPNDYEEPTASVGRSNEKARQNPHSGKFEDLVSDNTQSGIYDRLQGAFNTNNVLSAAEDTSSTVYTNTAFSNADDRESTVYENLKS